MLLVSVGLTAMTLVVVQRTVDTRVRRSLAHDLQDARATLRNVQTDRETNLRATAQLMADLPIVKALMTSRHAPTIQDASKELFQLSGEDLLALFDPSGQLMGLHSKPGNVPREAIEQILRDRAAGANQIEWWYADGKLYEVYLEPIRFGPSDSGTLLGVLAIGYELNAAVAGRARQMGASEVAVLYRDTVVASTLSAAPANVLQHATTAPTDITINNEKFIASSMRLNGDDAPPVVIVVMKSYDNAIAFLKRLQRMLLAIGILAVLVGGGIVSVLAKTFTRPLEELAEGVSALGSGDFAFPLHSGGSGEVVELTLAFTEMRDRLREAQQRLVESERLATIGRMASSISHDLRHPLTAVLANAEFLADPALLGSQREELYLEIRFAVNRLTDLIDSLLELSRPAQKLVLVDAPIAPPIHRAVELIRTHPQFQKIAMEIEAADDVHAWIEPHKLERAFYNLLLNACQAVSPENGLICVRVCETSTSTELRFLDNGSGVPDAIRAELFHPFISAGKQNGTGLGLTIAHKIVQDHGGTLVLESSEPGSTTFVITLPRAAEAPIALPGAVSKQAQK